jgi:hypothetical protein
MIATPPIVRRRSRSTAAALVACVLSAGPLAAQVRPAPTDTAAVPRAAEQPAGIPHRSPGGAFVRSLVLPGWGQAWVGAPGRGGVYFALEGASLWMLYRTQQRLDQARAEQRVLHDSGVLPADSTSGLVRSRERQREDWIALSVFLLFFSGADAYVSAHLADFGERVGVTPTPEGALRIRATVPVGGRR